MYHEIVGLKFMREQHEKENDVVAVTVDTYEDDDYPVVRHVFYGMTEAEARGYITSHQKTDKFFAACDKGSMGKIKCSNTEGTVSRVPIASFKK